MVFLMAFLFVGCNDYEVPVFDKIRSVKVHEINKDYVTLTGRAIFNNPGQTTYKVKRITLQVIYNEQNIASIKSIKNSRVKAYESFEIPFNIELPTEVFRKNLVSDIMNILGGREFSLQFNGELTVSKFGFNRKVPINHQHRLKIKM